MDPITAFLIFLGTAFSAGVSAYGASQANKANQKIASDQMAFNSAEAQKDRDFQLMMSNTAHQREVADLKAAGLNPWLSVSGTGATSGVQSSSASSNSTIGRQENVLSSVASISNSLKDIALIDALTKKATRSRSFKQFH